MPASSATELIGRGRACIREDESPGLRARGQHAPSLQARQIGGLLLSATPRKLKSLAQHTSRHALTASVAAAAAQGDEGLDLT